MAATLGVAVGVYAVRLLAVYLGSWMGAWMGGTPAEHRSKVWQGMITQVCRRAHKDVMYLGS